MGIVAATIGLCDPQVTTLTPQRQSDLPQDNGESVPGAWRRRAGNAPQWLRLSPGPQQQLYLRELTDPFVPGSMIEKFGLREGLHHQRHGSARPPATGAAAPEITDVDGMPPEQYRNVKTFDQLTPINPDLGCNWKPGQEPMTTRVMDLLTPLGKGQRALIVAPPRSGKTILLQHISHGIATNYPDVKLIVLLDRRAARRSDRHAARRQRRGGRQQSGSRHRKPRSALATGHRALQAAWPKWARTWFCSWTPSPAWPEPSTNGSATRAARCRGGVDIKAMDIPKKLFATARLFEEGGSLTIIGTALVDTGSRMDELIFQEFKGTGNMELVLDRKLADRRVWPAIDISQSGTRREEKLLPPDIAARRDHAPPHAWPRCIRWRPWSS